MKSWMRASANAVSGHTSAAAPVIGFAYNFSVAKQMKALRTIKTDMLQLATVPGIAGLQSIAIRIPDKA